MSFSAPCWRVARPAEHGRLTDDSWLVSYNDSGNEQWQRLGAIQAVCTAIACAQ